MLGQPVLKRRHLFLRQHEKRFPMLGQPVLKQRHSLFRQNEFQNKVSHAAPPDIEAKPLFISQK